MQKKMKCGETTVNGFDKAYQPTANQRDLY